MSKKQKAPKGAVVWRQTAEQATLAKKPRYNGFACGHGVHGGTKYNRQKAKRALERQLKQEGAPRGSFLLCCDVVPRGVSGDVRSDAYTAGPPAADNPALDENPEPQHRPHLGV